jgi:transposase
VLDWPSRSKFVTACCLHTDAHGHTRKEHRTFTTMTSDIEALGNWLAAAQCTQIAIESTGVFWQPIYNLLEERFQVWLVNPQHSKPVPGRKTDGLDADWLAQLLQHGLLRARFIPSREQRELRELLRHRQSLVEQRNRITNRVRDAARGHQ